MYKKRWLIKVDLHAVNVTQYGGMTIRWKLLGVFAERI